MKYSNKPVPNQSWRRYFKNLIKNYTRNKDWKIINDIPELLELGIIATLYDVRSFLHASKFKHTHFARVAIRIGKAAKKTHAYLELSSLTKICYMGHAIYFHDNHQILPYRKIPSKNRTYLWTQQHKVVYTEPHKLPFVTLN